MHPRMRDYSPGTDVRLFSIVSVHESPLTRIEVRNVNLGIQIEEITIQYYFILKI